MHVVEQRRKYKRYSVRKKSTRQVCWHLQGISKDYTKMAISKTVFDQVTFHGTYAGDRVLADISYAKVVFEGKIGTARK